MVEVGSMLFGFCVRSSERENNNDALKEIANTT
jgi:hypothetical protein